MIKHFSNINVLTGDSANLSLGSISQAFQRMQRLKLAVSITTFVLFGLIISMPSMAKELTVGLSDTDYPPFYYMKDGKLEGTAIEIAEQIAQNLGHKLIYKRYPWRRFQLMLETGEVDMSILYLKTPARSQYVIYTNTPHIFESSHLFVLRDSDIQFNGTLRSLEHFEFGHVRGYSHGVEYDFSHHINKHEFISEKELIAVISKGRLDIGVGNKRAIQMYATEQGVLDRLKFLDPPIDHSADYFAFSRAREDAVELAEAFSVQINRFVKTEQYKRIIQKKRQFTPGSQQSQ